MKLFLKLGAGQIGALALNSLLLTGCSFHSNQLDILTSLFEQDDGPEPQWVFSWGPIKEEVFAINAGESILFANAAGFLVRFNGSFVDRLEKLKFGADGLVDISISKSEIGKSQVFKYVGKMANYGEIICSAANETYISATMDEISQELIEVRQNCVVGGKEMDQRLILDRSRRLVSLAFFIHPAREPAMISYRLLKTPLS